MEGRTKGKTGNGKEEDEESRKEVKYNKQKGNIREEGKLGIWLRKKKEG